MSTDRELLELAAKAAGYHVEARDDNALAIDRDEREAALRAEVERLKAAIDMVDLYEQASIYASAFGREEPNRDDYVAALRDAVDAAMAQAKDAEDEVTEGQLELFPELSRDNC